MQNHRPRLENLIQLNKVQFLSEICEDSACKELWKQDSRIPSLNVLRAWKIIPNLLS